MRKQTQFEVIYPWLIYAPHLLSGRAVTDPTGLASILSVEPFSAVAFHKLSTCLPPAPWHICIPKMVTHSFNPLTKTCLHSICCSIHGSPPSGLGLMGIKEDSATPNLCLSRPATFMCHFLSLCAMAENVVRLPGLSIQQTGGNGVPARV